MERQISGKVQQWNAEGHSPKFCKVEYNDRTYILHIKLLFYNYVVHRGSISTENKSQSQQTLPSSRK